MRYIEKKSGELKAAAMAGLVAAMFVMAGATGCAHPRPPVARTWHPGAPVRIDGVRFLSFYTTRARAIEQMLENGFVCQRQAATPVLVPCTHTGAGNLSVVLSFVRGHLDGVSTSLRVTEKDPRDQFDRLYAQGHLFFERAFVERGESAQVARFMPGDGSVVEIYYLLGLRSFEISHFGLTPAEEAIEGLVSQR